jgi:hypothetical protein
MRGRMYPFPPLARPSEAQCVQTPWSLALGGRHRLNFTYFVVDVLLTPSTWNRYWSGTDTAENPIGEYLFSERIPAERT